MMQLLVPCTFSSFHNEHSFNKKTCRDAENCMVCSDEDGGRCRGEGVTYEVMCKGCESKYISETPRNAFTRGLEHRSDVQKKEKKSPMHLHNIEQHDGNTSGLRMKVTGVFGGDATKRQVREAVVIQQTPRSELINRRDRSSCRTSSWVSPEPLAAASQEWHVYVSRPSICHVCSSIIAKHFKWPISVFLMNGRGFPEDDACLVWRHTWQSDEERPSLKLTIRTGEDDCKRSMWSEEKL